MNRKFILLTVLGSFILPLSVYANNHQKLEDSELKALKYKKQPRGALLTKNQLKNKRSIRLLSTLKKAGKKILPLQRRRNINKKSFLSARHKVKDNKNLIRRISQQISASKEQIEVLKEKNTAYEKKLQPQAQEILGLKKKASNSTTNYNTKIDNSSILTPSITPSQIFPITDKEIIKKSSASSFKIQQQQTEIKELLQEMSTILASDPEAFEDYLSYQFNRLVKEIEKSPEYAAHPDIFNQCYDNIQRTFAKLENLDFSKISNRNIHKASSRLLSDLIQNLKTVNNFYKNGKYSHYVDFLIKAGEKAQDLFKHKNKFENLNDINALIQNLLSSLNPENIVKG